MRGNRRAVPPLKGPSAMCWPSGEGFRVRMRTVSSMKGLSFLSNSTQDSATLRPGLSYSTPTALDFRLSWSNSEFGRQFSHERFRAGLISCCGPAGICLPTTNRCDLRPPAWMKRGLARSHPTSCTVVTNGVARSSNGSEPGVFPLVNRSKKKRNCIISVWALIAGGQ